MQAKILSKKEQKSSLSGKKTKTKETIRNVLATPFSKYWPLISHDDVELLSEVLFEYLPKIQKLKCPGQLLKVVPKSERKSFRKEYFEKLTGDIKQLETGDRDGLTIGVNDTTSAIEKRTAKSVLITADVQPRLMVEHLIDQSVLSRIPVLVVPKLREILKKSFNFPSIAIAFTDTTKYEMVQQKIEDIYKKYPVPRDHIHFQRSLDLVNTPVVVIEDSILEDGGVDTINASNKDSLVKPEAHNVYLYRKTGDKRVFIPVKTSNEQKNNNEMQVDSSGFLSFSADLSPVVAKKIYTSLKVKKVRADINRKKRKIEKMKETSRRQSNKKTKNISEAQLNILDKS